MVGGLWLPSNERTNNVASKKSYLARIYNQVKEKQ